MSKRVGRRRPRRVAREPPLPCCASTHTIPWQSLLAHSSDARHCSGHWKCRDARESEPKHGTARTSCRRGPRRGLGRWHLTAETVCGQRSTRGRQPGRRGVHLPRPGRPPRGPGRLPPWAVLGFCLRGSRTGFKKSSCSCGLREGSAGTRGA